MFSRLHLWAKANKSELLVLLSILAVALFLRASRIPNQIIWNGDTARDMTVARHLWLYHEPLAIGHSAYGLRIDTPLNAGDPYGMSHYPTYYYRALSVIFGISQNVSVVSALFVLYQVAGLAVLYYGLRQAFGKTPALFGIIPIAVSIKALEHSLGVTLHPALPIFFTVFALCVTAWKKEKLWPFIAATILCVLGTLIHYSFLVCFVWVVAAAAYQIYHSKEKKHTPPFIVGMILGGVLLFLALHTEIISFYGFWPFIKTFTAQYPSNQLALSHAATQFTDIVMFRLRGLFPVWLAGSVALTLGTIYLAYATHPKLQSFFNVIFGFFASLLILASFKPFETFHYEQIVFFDYGVLALFGVSCGLIFTNAKKEGKLATLLVMGLLLTSLTNLWYTKPPVLLTKSISAAKEQAQQLIDHSPYPLEETEFYVSSYYSWDYETPTVLYWMEVLSGKKLAQLVNVYNNLGWPEPTKTHMIASCQRYIDRPNSEASSCQTMLGHFVQTGKYTMEKELFSNENYRTFLFKKI